MANRTEIGAHEFTRLGDANLDGYVDVVDLLSLARAFGTVAGLLDLVYNFGR